MVLRPHLKTRLAFAAFGLPPMGVSIAAITSNLRGAGLPFAILAVLSAAGWWIVRNLRAAVIVTDDRFILRGLFRPTTVPRASVVALTGNPPNTPAITWVDGAGRKRYIALGMFADSRGEFAAVKRYNRAALAELARALDLPRRARG